MKKQLITMLAIGLVAGALVGPAEAKKKKPKPPKPAQMVQADQKYFLVNATDGCAEGSTLLMLSPADTGTNCGAYFAGVVNTALVTSGESTCVDTPEGPLCGNIVYTAGEGLPFTLDATKKVTGSIFVQSYGPEPAGVVGGATEFNLELLATVNGEEKVLGTFSKEYTTNPTEDTYEVPFEIALDSALDKGQVSALSLNLYNTGASAMHGFYEVNTSNFVVPTWKAAR